MVVDSYVNHVPVMTGGVGHDELRQFYSQRFIPQMPPDTAMTPVSRTIGIDRVVDEMVFEFYAHDQDGLDAAGARADGSNTSRLRSS
jgi:carboxymethylenebutenolidase